MSIRSEVIRIYNELIAGSKKISELPSAGAITGAELVEIVQNGVNVQTTTSQFGGGGGGTVSITTWSFPAGALPTSANVIYIATADYLNNGDDGYIATGEWFVALTTPTTRADFYVIG